MRQVRLSNAQPIQDNTDSPVHDRRCSSKVQSSEVEIERAKCWCPCGRSDTAMEGTFLTSSCEILITSAEIVLWVFGINMQVGATPVSLG